MASCEKCWDDAYYLQDGDEGHYKTYSRLIKERKDKPCTPEEQAGRDAEECPKCKRKTMHQMVKGYCTNCKM